MSVSIWNHSSYQASRSTKVNEKRPSIDAILEMTEC